MPISDTNGVSITVLFYSALSSLVWPSSPGSVTIPAQIIPFGFIKSLLAEMDPVKSVT